MNKIIMISKLYNIALLKYIGILKGKRSFIIFQRRSNLKYKFGQQSFWPCYYIDTVGKNAKRIAEYMSMRNQLQ